MQGPDGGKVRDLLSPKRPYSDDTAERVIDLVRGGGYVEQAFEETRSRIKAADAAISTLPATETTGVFANLGEYLLERVESARPSV